MLNQSMKAGSRTIFRFFDHPPVRCSGCHQRSPREESHQVPTGEHRFRWVCQGCKTRLDEKNGNVNDIPTSTGQLAATGAPAVPDR